MNKILKSSNQNTKVPNEISKVFNVTRDFLPQSDLEYEEIFGKIGRKYVLYQCSIKSHYRDSFSTFITKQYGLTIRIFQEDDYIGYNIFAYPNSLDITTEFGETLLSGLKSYFRMRIKREILYYKKLKMSVKGK